VRRLPLRSRRTLLVSITLDTYSHTIPAMRKKAALIAGLVFAGE